jgi:hypothetical protein
MSSSRHFQFMLEKRREGKMTRVRCFKRKKRIKERETIFESYYFMDLVEVNGKHAFLG